MTLLLFLSKPYTFCFMYRILVQWGRSSAGQHPYLLPDSSLHTSISTGPCPTMSLSKAMDDLLVVKSNRHMVITFLVRNHSTLMSAVFIIFFFNSCSLCFPIEPALCSVSDSFDDYTFSECLLKYNCDTYFI